MFQLTMAGGVEVRSLEERHAPEVFSAVDRERSYLREWLPWVDGTTVVSDTLAFIQTALQQSADNDGLTAGIWCNREFAGIIGTHKIDWLNRRVELGYWIASGFQGRGIITNACRALVRHCFDEWKLHRVEIHCATVNVKSCAIPQRLGFRLEGLLREAELVNGRYYDLNLYATLASEWERSS